MRLHRLAVVAVLVGVAVVVVACGLDQSGLLVENDAGKPTDGGGKIDVIGVDVALPDADVPDVVVPPACATLDASCLPAYPPDAGWTVVAVPTGAKTCPNDDGGWITTTFVTDAVLATGSCGYACSTASAACATTAKMTHGMNDTLCSDGGVLVALPQNQCTIAVIPAGSLRATYVGPTNLATTCDGGTTGDAQAATTPVPVCSTNACDIDYCGLGQKGFRRCIIHEKGAVACPAGYMSLGVGKGAVATCGSATCNVVTPATCTPAITSYVDMSCLADADTIPADGSCFANKLAGSAKLTVTANAASCTASPTGAGAGLIGAGTVCCIP
ncbi:hypothetical protein BH09MYX1_BH09MYX1_54070 [soil metagenome]